ncbi:uncharacterized protein A4U43_C05F7470 [Asparagus officinalis]|uniref:Uncharacterized protein n=1 Tax=Asparagus officinalis TaxID=4686 RepID=A0A5P1EQ05_ASPOF|nr:uncharacterized protein A4U43_C05F7470 [Asparagus officinalis]
MKIQRNRTGNLPLKGQLVLASGNHLNPRFVDEHLAKEGGLGKEAVASPSITRAFKEATFSAFRTRGCTRGSSRTREESHLENGNVVAPIHIPASDEFEPAVDFDGAFGALEPEPTIDVVVSPTPMPVFAVRHRLVSHELSEEDDDASVSSIPVGVWR